jgi:hypothetical protein
MCDNQQQMSVADRETCLTTAIKEYEKVTAQLAKLTKRKEELTKEIIDTLGHCHEGQKSYDYDQWKIECKTPMTYSLDKKAYESGDYYIPDNFDPVRSSVSYTVNKQLFETYASTAPLSVREALHKLIDKKPAKASVTIKARV